MFVCMDAIRRERLSLGELSPVGRLRGVVLMHIFYFAVTPLRHRCAMPPAPGRLLLPYGQFCTSQQILDTNRKKIYNKKLSVSQISVRNATCDIELASDSLTNKLDAVH